MSSSSKEDNSATATRTRGTRKMHYILTNDREVVAVSAKEWGRWFDTTDRHVADLRDEDIRISTTFIGLDHSSGDGPPLVFETLVFGGPLDGEEEHCSTWQQAIEMHHQMAQRVTLAVLELRGVDEDAI